MGQGYGYIFFLISDGEFYNFFYLVTERERERVSK
jgi:hypothetical protein